MIQDKNNSALQLEVATSVTSIEDQEDSEYDAIGNLIKFQYRVISNISNGRFSKVLNCFDERNLRQVALKKCNIQGRNRILYWQELHALMQFKKRFGQADKGVIQLLDSFSFNNQPCIVTELMGLDLQVLIRQPKSVAKEQIATITSGVLKGLAGLQELNIVHCNISPRNIVLKNFDSLDVKIIDLRDSCFAGIISPGLRTLEYEAPELILEVPCSKKTDIWSVALIIIEMVTKKQLFNGTNELHQMRLISEDLGPPPEELLLRSRVRHRFPIPVQQTGNSEAGTSILPYINEKPRLKLESVLSDFDPEISDFVTECLHWNESDRISVTQGLNHPLLKGNVRSRRNIRNSLNLVRECFGICRSQNEEE